MSTMPAITDWEVKAEFPETSNRIRFDIDIFRQKFNRAGFFVRHNLAEDPLLSLPNLVELSRRLPQSSVKYNDGGLRVSADLEKAPGNGLSVEETIRRIEEKCSWMVLKNVHEDPLYRELLMRCLEDIKVHSERLEPGMCEPRAFIFISSPNSVTPFHIDPEINFLLQIRGSKTMSIFDPFDREILPEETLEQFFLAEDLGIVKYKDGFQSRAFIATISPGIGVHCPVTAPHWVQNGPEVSISFSITFRSASTRRRRNVYWINAHLRRLGLSPRPYGASAWRDQLKSNLFRTMAAAKRVAR
jgi:hypothetical protein